MKRFERWAVPLVIVVVLAPLAVTLVAQRSMRWTPVFDLAMIELRVRDVTTGHWPLLGLVGRIGTPERLGSHPGPLAFYLLAPVYSLLARSSWALEAASRVYQGAAVVVAVLLGRRRAGLPGAVAVAALVALVVQGVGLATLAEPWNPYLPVLWFVVCLVATWSVIAGDRPMLLVAVFAASVCAQTHVPYLAVTTVLLGIGALAALRRGPRWVAGAAALGLLLWTPPIVDQLVHDPGNLSILLDHFGTPPEATIGFREGGRLLLERLDVWHLAVDSWRDPGDLIGVLHPRVPVAGRGVAMLVAWLAAAAASLAWLRSRRTLLALHAVAATSVAAAWFAIARIFGAPHYYLMLWAWTVGGLLLVATAWTVAELVARTRPAWRSRVRPVAIGLAVAVVVLSSGRMLAVPKPVELGLAPVGDQLGRLLPETERGLVEAGARRGRWLVTWDDSAHLGSQGYGLVNELERRHFEVGVVEYHRVNFVPHRMLREADAAGRIHLVTGNDVERWAAVEGATRIAYDDPRSPAQRRHADEVLDRLKEELRAAGAPDLADELDVDLWSARSDPRIQPLQGLAIDELREIGVPAAVYLVPVDASL
jgi:hypothetical protein